MKSVTTAVLLLLAATDAFADTLVPQQRGKPCAVMWEIGGTPKQGVSVKDPWTLECADGDAACDVDGRLDGACAIHARACVAPSSTKCRAKRWAKLKALTFSEETVSRLEGFSPPPFGVVNACGATGTITMTADDAPVLLDMSSRLRRKRGRNAVSVRCVRGACPGCGPGTRAMALTTRAGKSDVDIGFSGESHNFPLVEGTRFDACLSGCDDTTDPICNVTPACSGNGKPIGAPLPMLSNGVPVCMVTRQTATAQPTGSMNLTTGELNLPVALEVDVHVQTADPDGDNVCPRCDPLKRTCSAGAREGLSCTVDGRVTVTGSGGSPEYLLSSECPPDTNKKALTIPLSVTFTTGESALQGSKPCPAQVVDDSCGSGACTFDCSEVIPAKGGLNQTCCSNNQLKPCFSTAPDGVGSIVRAGTPSAPVPAWPSATYPKSTDAVMASTFCMPKTFDSTVDILTGLPGPVAVLAPVRIDIR